jgi:HSP20 family protein
MHDRDWQVLRELMELRSRFTSVLERVMMAPPPALSSTSSAFEPAADVWETDSELVVEVELPGARGEDVEVRLERQQLIISGQLPAAAGAEGRHLCVERPRGRFHRAIPLPVEVAGEPAATLTAGVLEVRLPRPTARRRRIAVSGGKA